jgi:hypothetical protein
MRKSYWERLCAARPDIARGESVLGGLPFGYAVANTNPEAATNMANYLAWEKKEASREKKAAARKQAARAVKKSVAKLSPLEKAHALATMAIDDMERQT